MQQQETQDRLDDNRERNIVWILGQPKKKLSITHDYTIDERKVIKEYVEEAKKRNNTGTKGYVWKVRGTPRNGMKLMKIQTQD